MLWGSFTGSGFGTRFWDPVLWSGFGIRSMLTQLAVDAPSRPTRKNPPSLLSASAGFMVELDFSFRLLFLFWLRVALSYKY